MTKVITIPDPISDKFIKLKILTIPEYESLVGEAKEKLITTKDSFTLLGYQIFLCEKLIVSFPKIVNKLEDNNKGDFLESMYVYIFNLYPKLHHNFICKDLNKGLSSELEEDGRKYLEDIKEDVEEEGAVIVSDVPFNSIKDVNDLREDLESNIIGQSEAINSVINNMKNVASGLYPRVSFFLLGPTGTGKTSLAKVLGKKFKNLVKINCAEFSSDKGEYSKLIGAPPGYIGHTSESLLAEKASKSNRWVFIFDEIEKAHPKFYDWLLGLLDDGKINDNQGRELDFSRSIFIFTSNKGVHESYGNVKLGFLPPNESKKVTYEESKDRIIDRLKEEFTPEFLGRIDEVILFNKLSKKDIRKIIENQLSSLPIKKTTRLINYVMSNSYEEEHGARDIKSFIKRNIASVLSEEMLKIPVEKRSGIVFDPHITNNKLKVKYNVI